MDDEMIRHELLKLEIKLADEFDYKISCLETKLSEELKRINFKIDRIECKLKNKEDSLND